MVVKTYLDLVNADLCLTKVEVICLRVVLRKWYEASQELAARGQRIQNLHLRRAFRRWQSLAIHVFKGFYSSENFWRLKCALSRWQRQTLVTSCKKEYILANLNDVRIRCVLRLLHLIYLPLRSPPHLICTPPVGVLDLVLVRYRSIDQYSAFEQLAKEALVSLAFRRWRHRLELDRVFTDLKKFDYLQKFFLRWKKSFTKQMDLKSKECQLMQKPISFLQRFILSSYWARWITACERRTSLKISLLEFVNERLKRDTSVWILCWRHCSQSASSKTACVTSLVSFWECRFHFDAWIEGFVSSRRQRLVAHKFETRVLYWSWMQLK
eukprot:Gregarina_sp_Poly_1__7282@NODE_3_length_27868_cov_154_961188_g2_i0_p10_GENE_NODE_3_length_27868_cov_154_961188_g2_i0NODE_3_length_27868_cov_154_961188_g2_i0_p10_ORF_typecomplete_len325_score23_88Sfi1/PF08457_10/0_19Sfi1/PF08457_10/0_031DUF3974/PF13120_6/0_073_NODE_3_length_27868_cov_154_961188_g2_i066527626